MSDANPRGVTCRLILVFLLLACTSTPVGCAKHDQAGSGSSQWAPWPASDDEQSTKQPGYRSWAV